MKIMNKRTSFIIFLSCTIWIACVKKNIESVDQSNLDVEKTINYCQDQARKSLEVIPSFDSIPRRINSNTKKWEYVSLVDWTSGFWSGVLWYLYENQPDALIKEKAERFTVALAPILETNKWDHDLGFMYYCSYGNAYRITQKTEYKEILLRAADSLVTLYNPKVGTILSWPGMVNKMNWPHNTIADNMMNLELLFWAAKNGRPAYAKIAVNHATTTMRYQIRPDYSMYHVAVYDTTDGQFIKGVTHQGYADESMWARGQAWGIYGFTLCYRETNREEFLTAAQKLADKYLERLPEDKVPFWDFDAPLIPNEPKDASAAAIAASALLELSTMGSDEGLKKKYKKSAEEMLAALSSKKYLSENDNYSFISHSTGHWPNKSEVDVPIIYGDYYFIEALLRWKKLNLQSPEKVSLND